MSTDPLTLRRMLQRLPLTIKTLLATAMVGLVTWGALDAWQTSHLKALFHTRLSEAVEQKALENRVLFDRHIKSHHQAVHLLASQDRLHDYLVRMPTQPPNGEVVFHRNPPDWLPRPSVMRTFVPLRYILLLDASGQVREVYQGGLPEPPPQELLQPTPLLRQLSHNQTFLTYLNGQPFLVASETITIPKKATLMLANPLDDTFLMEAQGPARQYASIIALLEGDDLRIIATNRPDQVPTNIAVGALGERFVVAGKSFFDYGSSDLLLQLVTLISTEEFESLGRHILLTERQQRAITAFVLILSSLLIIFWITRNIEHVSRQIADFSRNTLGIRLSSPEMQDEMVILKYQFMRLTEEIIRTRDNLRAELEERERAEAEIRKLSQAVEQSPAAVMITDLKGMTLYVNTQFTVLTGYTPSEVVGRNPRFLQSGKVRSETYRALWDTISSGKTWKGRLHNVRKDGAPYWEMNTISPIRNANGETTHFLAIKEDITPRMQMEAAMRRARQAAEAANQVKNDFLANITHELRTPLNAITGFTNMILNQEFGPVTKSQKRYLKNVLESARQLAGLINDLLDISKVDSEQFILEKGDFPLHQLVNQVVHSVSAAAREKGLSLTCRIASEVGSMARGDSTRLRQVLHNILRNAVKFTHKGFVAMAVAPDQRPGAKPHAVLFTIADTGIGIPGEKLDTIFDPFTQGDNSASREYGGSGLGLAIAKRVIELMGGEIWVESRENEGSTFYLSVPLEPLPEPVAPDKAVENFTVPPGLKVLVVGQNPVNRLILKKLLATMDLTVVEAGGCQSAMDSLGQTGEEPFQLLFLDCSHSATNGIETVRQIHEQHAFRHMPTVMFSAEGAEGGEVEMPGVYYLRKPIQRSQVYETVKLALVTAQQQRDRGTAPAAPEGENAATAPGGGNATAAPEGENAANAPGGRDATVTPGETLPPPGGGDGPAATPAHVDSTPSPALDPPPAERAPSSGALVADSQPPAPPPPPLEATAVETAPPADAPSAGADGGESPDKTPAKTQEPPSPAARASRKKRKPAAPPQE